MVDIECWISKHFLRCIWGTVLSLPLMITLIHLRECNSTTILYAMTWKLNMKPCHLNFKDLPWFLRIEWQAATRFAGPMKFKSSLIHLFSSTDSSSAPVCPPRTQDAKTQSYSLQPGGGWAPFIARWRWYSVYTEVKRRWCGQDPMEHWQCMCLCLCLELKVKAKTGCHDHSRDGRGSW